METAAVVETAVVGIQRRECHMHMGDSTGWGWQRMELVVGCRTTKLIAFDSATESGYSATGMVAEECSTTALAGTLAAAVLEGCYQS